MKKKTKIVKFLGGLGNQMFQYAFAKVLEEKENVRVLFDISSYKKAEKNIVKNTDTYKSGLSVRHYEIDFFKNADIKLASRPETICVKLLNLFGISKKYKEKDAFKYDENIFSNKYRYFSGYYQNEKYFKCIRNRLINDFEFPPLKDDDEYNKKLYQEIVSSNNPVFIHIRRGDYLKLNYSLPLEYYAKAVEYIKSNVENPTFFVFCAEDTDYVKNEFNIGCDFKLIGEKNVTRENFYENMRLMTICKHGILANSSYSWWAGWLNNNKDKIIIAPSPWLKNSDGAICEDWIKIKV